MNTKMLGGILLIVGTCIGGAMLALPIAVAPSGFFYSSLLLILCWALMTFSAFLILEVNSWLPVDNNIISMAKATVGDKGALVAWLSYLFLFYCLLAAYISSGADILHHLFTRIGFPLSTEISALLFLFLFGYVVYRGIQSVDYVNRGLMFTKGGTYLLLVGSTIAYVGLDKIPHGQAKHLITSVTVMITSYGYATIVPSLRSYFQNDIPRLRNAIIIGSLIPLFCYILWDFIVLGMVPFEGSHGLRHMMTSGHSTTELAQAIGSFLNNPWITAFTHMFTSVCVATSFLGVSLGLTDFLADGFSLEKEGKNNIVIYSAAFLPPLFIVLFYPNAFIMGLSYAGIFCTILLMFMPAWMAWHGRYKKNIASGYQVVGGKPALLMTLTAAIIIIFIGLIRI